MKQLSRRTLCQQTLGTALTYSLLESLWQTEAFGSDVAPLVHKWVADVDALGREVKGQKVSQIIWQQKMEDL